MVTKALFSLDHVGAPYFFTKQGPHSLNTNPCNPLDSGTCQEHSGDPETSLLSPYSCRLEKRLPSPLSKDPLCVWVLGSQGGPLPAEVISLLARWREQKTWGWTLDPQASLGAGCSPGDPEIDTLSAYMMAG